MFEFTIPGEAVPKGRPRCSKAGYAYTPKTTRDAEERVLELFQDAGGQMLDGLICMEVTVYAKSTRRKDLDNIAKLVTDALNGYAYKDDEQIDLMLLRRFRGCDDPRTVVRVGCLES
jgi:Holliday junction resolvase RusA-like endonuclease